MVSQGWLGVGKLLWSQLKFWNSAEVVEGSEKAMATHSSTVAWKSPWTEEPGRLQSMGSQSQTRLSDFSFTFHFHALEKEMATHSSALAWRVPGTAEPGVLSSMGSYRVGHNWSDLAAAATSNIFNHNLCLSLYNTIKVRVDLDF